MQARARVSEVVVDIAVTSIVAIHSVRLLRGSLMLLLILIRAAQIIRLTTTVVHVEVLPALVPITVRVVVAAAAVLVVLLRATLHRAIITIIVASLIVAVASLRIVVVVVMRLVVLLVAKIVLTIFEVKLLLLHQDAVQLDVAVVHYEIL